MGNVVPEETSSHSQTDPGKDSWATGITRHLADEACRVCGSRAKTGRGKHCAKRKQQKKDIPPGPRQLPGGLPC
jgi:hypothetical protein